MTKGDLIDYYHRHCRLRLRSGKEVFGVLWEDERSRDKLYFASHGEHEAWQQAMELKQSDRAHRLAQQVSPDDIIAVESL